MRVPLQITIPGGARGGALCVTAPSAFIGPNCAAVTGTRKKKGAQTGTEQLEIPNLQHSTLSSSTQAQDITPEPIFQRGILDCIA